MYIPLQLRLTLFLYARSGPGALVGGWFISWGVYRAVAHMTRTTQNIQYLRRFSPASTGKILVWTG